MKFILSTVGISLLLHMAEDDEQRKLLNRISNDLHIPDELRLVIDQLGEKALTTLEEDNVNKNRRISAELNGLYSFYDGRLTQGSQDTHWLIATDTALGHKTANIVKLFLERKGFSQVQIFVPSLLSTATRSHFTHGMQEVLKWCEGIIPGYKDSGYQISFNLVGGFKSLQGYLNIIAMFYADEIVYIFEGSSELIRIPRLPIQIDPAPIQNYAMQFALMSEGHVFKSDDLSALPEGLIEIDTQDYATISEWGLLVWNRLRSDILSKSLLPFSHFVYTPSFRKDFDRGERQQKIQLQATLAKVESLLKESNGDTSPLKRDGGLQYDNYVNKKDETGRNPIGHFRISQGIRVSCVSKDGKLHLRRFGKEPDVNSNP